MRRVAAPFAPRHAVALASCFVAALVGCGGADESADASLADSASPDAGVVVDIPWLADGVPPIAPPAFAPCPAGWREVPGEGGAPTTCDPLPSGGAAGCPAGQAHFPGEAGCLPVGSPCPAGDFSDDLPTDRRVIYVLPGGTGDGTSPTSPYGSLSDFATGGLPQRTVIALSRGTHVGHVILTRGLTLWGACAAETVLTTPEPGEFEGVVIMRGSTGEVRDLTIADSGRAGITADGEGAEVVIDGVVIDGAEDFGVYAYRGAQVTARELVVHDTRSRGGTGPFGRGLDVEFGASAAVSRAVFDANRGNGVFASEAGTSLSLTDVIVSSTRGRDSDGGGGRGLTVQDGAMAEVNRALFEGNRGNAVFTSDEVTMVALTDVVIRNTESDQSDGLGGRGIGVQGGASLHALRTHVHSNREAGVYASDPGSTLVLTDSIIAGTRSRELNDSGGGGLAVLRGASAEVERVILDRNRDFGILVDEGGAAVTLTDLVVSHTQPRQNDGRFGRGLGVQRGATARVTRALFDANNELGIFVSEVGTSLTLEDTVVRDTESQESDGHGGRGLTAQNGATVDGARALFSANREVGVIANGEGTVVDLSHVVVTDTRHNACGAGTCSEDPVGHGVGSFTGGRVSLSRFVIARSALCGAQIARGGQLDLAQGDVREQPLGVCVQTDGYDLDRLTTGVRFIDNGTNLEASTLPVPDGETAFSEPP